MPNYEYKCPECGILERAHRIGTAPATEHCLGCGDTAVRVLSPPMLHRGTDPKRDAMAQAERSRHEPESARRAEPSKPPDREVNPAMRRLVGRENAKAFREVPHAASRPWHH